MIVFLHALYVTGIELAIVWAVIKMIRLFRQT